MSTLIERVRGGTWNPEADEGDREERNAMAARGYWQAFQAVQKNLDKILKGVNPGDVADADHGRCYRKLFAPSVTVGLLSPPISRAIATARSISASRCVCRWTGTR
jgi:hypothetical protein